MGVLDDVAVARQSGDNAGEILQTYIAKTGPRMVHNHSAAPAMQKQPTNTGGVEVDPMKK